MKNLFRVALCFLAPSVGSVGLGLAGCGVGETSDGGELVDVHPLDTDGDGETDGIDLDGDGRSDAPVPDDICWDVLDQDGDGWPDAVDLGCDGDADVDIDLSGGGQDGQDGQDGAGTGGGQGGGGRAGWRRR
jgi:hypothetical protein